MKAARLFSYDKPLKVVDVDAPRIKSPTEVLVRVTGAGVCHTDLHIVEGELPLPKLPLVPGHQIVGVVDALGSNAHAHSGALRLRIFLPQQFMTDLDGLHNSFLATDENGQRLFAITSSDGSA